jgi:hypothetical protein
MGGRSKSWDIWNEYIFVAVHSGLNFRKHASNIIRGRASR